MSGRLYTRYTDPIAVDVNGNDSTTNAKCKYAIDTTSDYNSTCHTK